jgi:hypothetical protein
MVRKRKVGGRGKQFSPIGQGKPCPYGGEHAGHPIPLFGSQAEVSGEGGGGLGSALERGAGS